MAHSHFDICIIGGGLIGSAAACALADNGFTVALLEANPQPKRLTAQDAYGLRVSAINAASSQFFKNLGIWPAIKAVRVSPYTDMQIWDGPDASPAGISDEPNKTSVASPPASIHFHAHELALPQLGYIIENDVITQALTDKLTYQKNVTLLQGQLSQLQHKPSNIEVHIGTKKISATLLIGADGQNSKVRSLAHIPIEYGLFDQTAIVARIKTAQPHQQTAYQHFLKTGPIAYLPLSDGSCSIVWSCDTAYAKTIMMMDDNAFEQAVARALSHRLGKVEVLSPRGAFPLKQIHAQSYISQRVALIGDAAHRTHPLAGLGANLGFVDAAALAETLSTAHQAKRDIGLPHTLRKYERWRRSQNTPVLAAMQGFKTAFGSQNPGLKSARRRGLSLADKIPPIKTWLTYQAMGQGRDLPKACQT